MEFIMVDIGVIEQLNELMAEDKRRINTFEKDGFHYVNSDLLTDDGTWEKAQNYLKSCQKVQIDIEKYYNDKLNGK